MPITVLGRLADTQLSFYGGRIVNVDRAVFAMAGTMILVSLTLGWLFSPYWYLLAAFVGANMLQAAFTGFCPAATIFRKLGIKSGSAFECAGSAR
jgi:hypothetical protein